MCNETKIMATNQFYFYFSATLLESFRAYLQGRGYITTESEMIQRLCNVGKEVLPLSLNSPMQAGLDFERLVANKGVSEFASLQRFEKACDLAKEISRQTSGLEYQALHKCQLTENIGIYGYSDWSNADTILELKTTRMIDMQRYTQSMQHKVLCVASGASQFMYIVTDFDQIKRVNINADATAKTIWRYEIECVANKLVAFIETHKIKNQNLNKVLIY